MKRTLIFAAILLLMLTGCFQQSETGEIPNYNYSSPVQGDRIYEMQGDEC